VTRALLGNGSFHVISVDIDERETVAKLEVWRNEVNADWPFVLDLTRERERVLAKERDTLKTEVEQLHAQRSQFEDEIKTLTSANERLEQRLKLADQREQHLIDDLTFVARALEDTTRFIRSMEGLRVYVRVLEYIVVGCDRLLKDRPLAHMQDRLKVHKEMHEEAREKLEKLEARAEARKARKKVKAKQASA